MLPTKKQKQILDFIKSYIKENGISPTMEEIRKGLKLKAISTVHEHINILVEKNFLTKNDNSVRSIELVEKNGEMISIPLLGIIKAGSPIEAIENSGETIEIINKEIYNPEKYYALKVSGDSMIEDGIFDGDTVIIKSQSTANNGETVVAIIDGNQATLKKIYKENNRFRLQPANQTLFPFYAKEVEIKGVVVQVIRNFHNNNVVENNKNKIFKTIDLFAGVGGIRLGFEKAGFKTIFSNDFDKNCKITYDNNFKDSKLIVDDIKNINANGLPDFDFLLAGFPCQAFSIAGYRQGFNDEKGRGNLFFEIARIIKEKKPQGFLLENVKNLKSHDNGRTFKIIHETLQELGYHIKTKVLNSMEYGNIPQNRERIYIVGFKDEKYINNFEFPEPTKLETRINDLLEKSVSEKYYYNGKSLYEKLKDFITDKSKVYQWRRQYVRENKKGVCPTLTANMGMGGHNVPIIIDDKGIRKLTPSECFKIQGFPLDYKLPEELSDSALYKQAGNSVSVPVIEAIALQIKKSLNSV